MDRMGTYRDRGDGSTTASPARRACDVAGCEGEGLHRAPKARDRLTDYYWFCIDHVRLYNQAWDFCAGMSVSEIEAMVRWDTTWQRPTRPLGGWNRLERATRFRVQRDFAPGGDGPRAAREDAHETAGAAPPAGAGELAALRELGLIAPVTLPEIKARYRTLVKQHHPDANGGDRQAEERLKRINQAYTTLKAFYGV